MLRVGVTGGIGSGKSTVSRRLAELGRARRRRRRRRARGRRAGRARRCNGSGSASATRVIRADGALDRAALAAIVFPDRDALDALDAITGPAIAARVARARAAAPRDGVSVYDMPLLVERGPLGARAPHRRRRGRRRDAGAPARRAARPRRGRTPATASPPRPPTSSAAPSPTSCSTTPARPTTSRAPSTPCGRERLEPYAGNLATGTRSRRPDLARDVVVEPRADWEPRAERVVARIAAALAATGVVTEVSHIGSTSVPGLLAKDVIDVQVGVRHLADADRDDVRAALAGRRLRLLPRHPQRHARTRSAPTPPTGPSASSAAATRAATSTSTCASTAPRAGDSRSSSATGCATSPPSGTPTPPRSAGCSACTRPPRDYVVAKEPWFEGAWQRATDWAERTGWQPR